MARHQLSWMDDHLHADLLTLFAGDLKAGAASLAPLGLGEATDDERATRDMIQDRVSDLIDGHHEDVSSKLIAALSTSKATIDAVALDMLRATGMDAAVLIYVAHAAATAPDGTARVKPLPSFRLSAGPARREEAIVAVDGGKVGVMAPMAADTFWVSGDPEIRAAGSLIIRRPLPNAVCLAMEGRKLSDVVSHPVLDPLELRIVRVSTPIGTRNTLIETDAAHAPIDMGSLTLESTRPDRRALAVHQPPRQRVDHAPSF